MDEIDEIEIGYRFLPAFWGKGLATAAEKTVLDWALEEKYCTRLVGCIHPDNQASKKVLSKFGFKKEKTVNVAFIPDLPIDLFEVFCMTPTLRLDEGGCLAKIAQGLPHPPNRHFKAPD